MLFMKCPTTALTQFRDEGYINSILKKVNDNISNRMQIFSKLQDSYDTLWKYVIRPPRTPYPQQAIGPQIFCHQNIKIKRNSFQLTNYQGKVFYGSHFVPLESDSYPCVIYLHGNASNQTQGLQYLFQLLNNNISLCTFDFSGCGNSEGEYISLGYYEWKDLEEVVKYIKKKQKVTKIGLWGRSMGAVTALRYVSMNDGISAAIYDSAFKSLEDLVRDLGSRVTKIPQWILMGALKIISTTVKQKANFDIFELNPQKNDLPYIKIPGYFIVGDRDEIIPAQHTIILFQKYKSKKKHLEVVNGLHNDQRPKQCIDNVLQFFKKTLFRKQKKIKGKSYKKAHYQNIQIGYFQEHKLIDNDIMSQKTNDSPNKFTNGSQTHHGDEFQQFQHSADQCSITNNISQSNIASIDQQLQKMANLSSKPYQDEYKSLKVHFNSTIVDLLKLHNTENEQKIKSQITNYDPQFTKLSIEQLNQFLW